MVELGAECREGWVSIYSAGGRAWVRDLTVNRSSDFGCALNGLFDEKFPMIIMPAVPLTVYIDLDRVNRYQDSM